MSEATMWKKIQFGKKKEIEKSSEIYDLSIFDKRLSECIFYKLDVFK